MNEKTISALLSGLHVACRIVTAMKLVSGSRAEGFALSEEFTHETPDTDKMFLYGDDWSVSEPDVHPSIENTLKAYFEMDTEDCSPCYCRIYVKSTQTFPQHVFFVLC